MIISLSKRFIFVHNPKTAGTSIRTALEPFAEKLSHRPKKHETITELQKRTKMDLSNFFIFGFTRNPWDRACSFYHHSLLNPKHKFEDKFGNLNDFIESLGRTRRPNSSKPFAREWVSVEQQHLFFNENTHIGRFETLEQDFSFIMDKIGVQTHLNHYNKSVKCRYQDLYNKKSIDIIADLYEIDIDKYDYTFDG